MINILFRLVVAILVFASLESHAADRALIMTIGEYRNSPLPGALLDEGNVRQILGRLGFPDTSIKSLKDAQLTAKGVEKALADLAASTENGDRLFVHFSGHGSSQLVNGRCEQALVGHDMHLVRSAVVADMLKQLRDKAAQVIVTIDACHSGGVVETAGLRGGIRKRFAPRFQQIAQEAACDQPANVIQETLTSGLRSANGTVVTKNYVFVAAARSDEVAYDDAERGGMATVSLMDCLNGSVNDTDKSGGISVDELAHCAQKHIDREFENDPVYRPHHLTLSGNAGIPLPIAVAAAIEPKRTLSAGSTAPRQFVTNGLQNSSAAANPVATLTDLLNGSDSRWNVKMDAQPSRARIGKDAYRLTVNSSQAGYLYLLYVGSDHKEFLQLYPADNENNQIMSNTALRIPGTFAAQGPAGINHLLAVVSNTPRDFSQVFKDQAAPATLGIAAALQEVNCVTRNLKRMECAGVESKSRNSQTGLIQAPVESSGLADSFGAAMIELIEE